MNLEADEYIIEILADLDKEQIAEWIKTFSYYSESLVVTWSTLLIGVYIYYNKNYIFAKYLHYRELLKRSNENNPFKPFKPFKERFKFFNRANWFNWFKDKKQETVTDNYNELKGTKNSKIRLDTLDEITKTKKHLIEILNAEFDRFFLKEILIVLKTYGNISDEIRVKFKNKYFNIIEATLSAKEKTIFSQNFDSLNTFKLFVTNHYLDRLLSLELYLSLGFDATENDITKNYKNFEIFKVLLDQKTNKEDNKNITELVENYFKEDK